MEHKLIEKYKSFIKAIDANPFDFMIEEKRIDFPSIGLPFIENFKTIGTTKAGCIIGEYYSKEKQKKYIVWLDSEGEPNFPIAKSINEFFSIVPWGTGFIYDIGSKILMNLDEKSEPVGNNLFIDEYQRIVGLKRQIQPEKIIGNAIQVNKDDLSGIIYKQKK